MAREVGAKLNLETKEAKDKLNEIEKQIKKYSKIKISLEADLAKLNTLKKQLSNIDKEIGVLNNRKITLEARTSNIDTLKKDIQNIDVLLNRLSDKKFEINTKLSHADDSVKELRQRLSEQANLISRYRSAIKSVKSSDLLDGETKKLWSNNIDKQLQSAIRYQNDLKSSLIQTTEEANNLKSALKGAKDNIAQSTKNLNDTKKTLNGQLRSAQAEADKTQKEINGVSKEIDKLNRKKVDIETKISDYGDVQSKLNKTYETLGKLDTEKTDINVELSNYNETMRQLSNLNTSVQKIKDVGRTMNSIGKSMTNVFSGMSNNPIGKFSHFLIQGVGYSSLYRMTSSLMNSFESTFSDAIKRMDTIANSKRAFSAMRFDDSVITHSIDDLENRIMGLPTTLDDALQSVMMISSVNKDLPYSVRLFDALNNSVLAFGGTSEQAKRAITQFSQAMGTGKLDARTYLSLTDANMTPALAKVAEMLGYSSDKMAKFKEDLGNGTITLDEFTDSLIKLNENGFDTMKALNSLAKENALQSIGSALGVARTQLSKGWTSIIQSLNDNMSELGLGTIPGNIAKLGNFAREKMEDLSSFLRDNKEEMGEFFDFVGEKMSFFKDIIADFKFDSFVDGLASYKWVLDGMKSTIEIVMNLFKGFSEFVGGGDVSKGVGRIAGTWLTLGFGLRFLGKTLEWISKPLSIYAKAKDMFFSKKEKPGFFDKISNLFSTKSNDKQEIGKNTISSPTFDINSFLKSASSYAKLAMIAGEIMLYAEAMKQLDKKIPDDLGNFTKKLGTLALTIGGMEAVVIATGKITEKLGASTAITGMLALLGTGGTMYMMAEAIGNLNKKIPSDIGDFSKKMANFAIAIGGFGIVIGALGGLVSIGGGLGGLVMTLGGIFTVALAGTMALVANGIESFADSMVSVAESIDGFQKIKLNKNKVDKNMSAVLSALDSLNGYSSNIVDSLLKLAKQKIDEGNFVQASSNIKKLSTIVRNLSVMESANINESTVEATIKTIKDTMISINNLLPFPKLKNMTEDISGNLSKTLSNILSMSDILKKYSNNGFTEVDTSIVTKQIEQVKTFVESLRNIEFPDVQGLIKSGFTNKNAMNLSKTLDTLISVFPKFNQLSKTISDNPINAEEFISKMNDLASLIGNIEATGLSWNFDNFVKAESVENAAKVIKNMNVLVNDMKVLDETIGEKDWSDFSEKIKELGIALSDLAFSENFNIDSDKLDTFSNTIKTFKKSILDLNTVGTQEINFEAINSMIHQIGAVLTNINNITGADKAKSIVAQIETLISKFGELITSLQGLNGQFQQVGTDWGNSIYIGFEEAEVDARMTAYIDEVIQSLKAKDMTDVGIKYGNNIVNGFRNSVAKLPSALNTAVTNLYSYSQNFQIAGQSLGNTFANAFNSAIDNIKTPNIPSPNGKKDKGKKDKKSVSYFSKGGRVFIPKGEDTIPAMLAHGEYVVNKNAVKGIGVRFLDKINSMDFKGAFSELMNSHSTYSFAQNKNTTINNYTTNNYDNRQVSFSGGNERQQELRAGRILRGMA